MTDGEHAHPQTYTMPPEVRAEVQRILDREARRLLAAQLEADPVGAPMTDRNDELA